MIFEGRAVLASEEKELYREQQADAKEAAAKAELGKRAQARSAPAACDFVLPFAHDFFENRASVNYLHTTSLPDVRICAAQLYVTNSFGDSQSTSHSYTRNPDGALRTLSGGQFSLQVSGYLATQQNAAPPLLVEASHAIRDMRAAVTGAPQDYAINIAVLQDGVPLGGDAGVLSIGPGKLNSNVVDGIKLPALKEDSALTVNITLNLPQNFQPSPSTNPGRDLTVTIRF